MILNAITLFCLARGVLGQSTTSTTPPPTTTPTVRPTNCTFDDVDVISFAKEDFFMINQTMYDYNRNITSVPPTGYFNLGDDVSAFQVGGSSYVTATVQTGQIRFSVSPILESREMSHSGEHFYYNFTLGLRCDGTVYNMNIKIPLIETNTFTPEFTKRSYKYTLFSQFDRDIQRLTELDPIIATDFDMSNTEVIFSIKENPYFDLQYNKVVPNSLHKNHTAILVPKSSILNLKQALELTIFVTDTGFPRKSSNATLQIVPAAQDIPTFKKSFYTGDYYLNNTFSMRSQPELQDVFEKYQVSAVFDDPSYSSYFSIEAFGNGTIAITKSYYNLPELTIYKYGYLALSLTVTYQNSQYYETTGSTTVIIELHTPS